VRHLLAGCAECQPGIAAFYGPVLFGPAKESPPPEVIAADESGYDAAIDRACAAVLQQLPRLAAELEEREERLLPARLLGFADAATRRSEQERAGWSFVETLLRRSAEERFRDRLKMLDLAIKAVEGTLALDSAVYGKERLRELRIRVLGELGNAYRLNEDFEEARCYLSFALQIVETEGCEDPLVVARVMDISASLRTNQRRLGEALETLDGVEKLYRENGETHLAGRALISQGIATFYDDRPREAVDLLRRGMAEIDPERDPQLATIARHNLIDFLADCGEYQEARRLYLEWKLWEELASDPVNLLKLRWVEGRILAGLRDLEQAERAFVEVREGFLARGEEYDAALVGIELSGVWLDQGKTFQVQGLAHEAYVVFRALEVHPEALRAVGCFRDACSRQEATADLVRQVLTFLRQVEWHPERRFAL
jgi:tetratricopeptide (TPR) repeat protein